MSWQPAGIDPKALWDTRLQLHWAAQATAGVGRLLLPKQDDFRHESFSWSAAHGALLQGVVEAPRPFQAGIRLRDMALLLLDGNSAVIDQLPMNGHTLDEGFAFFAVRAGSLLSRQVMLAAPPEGMPHHPVADGARFDADPEHLAELERCFRNAMHVLVAARTREEGAGAVRCWPHHFDVAFLIMLGGRGEDARTVGIGMSPGDEGIREPYYYVTPWPRPDAARPLPPLPLGGWHAEGWLGAVLTATEIAALAGARQEGEVSRFLQEAARHCRALAAP